MSIEIIPVWQQVTPELQVELVEFWTTHKAIPHEGVAAERAKQAVCITRDEDGKICGVSTAVIRVLPRLRQPLYFYRQFFAEGVRGKKQSVPFLNRARQILQEYNAGLETPESLGVLLELENQQLAMHYTRAYEPTADSTFIGYSPRGLHLRASYFDGARLLPPAPPRHRKRTAP